MFVLQREISCLNRENENQGFREIMVFDLQNTGQSHSFDENTKSSHGQYDHFALAGSFQNHYRKPVLDKQVESHFFFKSLGFYFETIFNNLKSFLRQFQWTFDPD